MCAKRPTYAALAKRVSALEAELEATRTRLRECEEHAPGQPERKLEETLLSFLDQATDGFILLDSNMRIVRISESSLRTVGRTPEEVAGRDLREVYVEAEPSGRYAKYLEVLRTGKPFSCDAVFHREHGDKQVSLTALRVGEHLGIMAIDTTARKQAEEAVRASEQRYRSLVENVNVGVYRNTGGPKGRFLQANPAIAEMFGYDSVDEFMQIHVADLYQNPEDRKRFVEEVAREGFVKNKELRLRKKDGTFIWCSCSARATRDDRGEIQWLDGVIEDITERKQAEEEIRRLNTDLERRVAERTAELEAANRELTAEVEERRRTQDALRKSEERYRVMYEAIPDAVFLYDSERREVIHGNGPFYQMYGYASDDLKGKTLESYWPVHPEDRERIRKLSETLQAQPGPRRYPVHRRLRKDGSTFWAEIATTDTELGGRPLKLIITHDVTDRIAAERALRESEQRYRTLAESAQEHILIIDKDLRVQYANTFAANQVRRTPEAVVGRTVWEVFPPDAARTLKHNVQAVFKSAQPVHTEDRMLLTTSAAEPVWLDTLLTPLRDEAGEIMSVLGIARDITRRKRAEEALRQSEERFRNVYDTAPLAFAIWDRECRVTGWNRHAERLFGWSRDEVLGRNFFDFIIPDSARPNVETIVAGLLRGELPSHHVNDNLTKDGRVITCEWNNSVLRDGEGRIVGAMSLAMDITERKQAEEALQESEERWRSLVENAPDIIMTIERDGTISFINRTSVDATPEEVAGTTIYDYLEPKYQDLARTNVERVFETGEPCAYQSRTLVTGEELWLDCRLAPLKRSGRTVAVTMIVTDITKRRRAEEALRQSEERYRTIYEAIPDAVLLYDPATQKLVSANDVMLELYGYTADEIGAGKVDLLDLAPESERDRIREELAASIDQPGPARRGVRPSVKKDGTLIWVNATTAPIEFGGRRLRMVILRDVTESVRAREQVERQAMLLANVTDAIAVADAEGTLSYWNRGAEELFGYSEGEMLGQARLGRLLRDSGQEADLNREIESAVRKQAVWSHDRLPCRRKDGEDIWVNVRVSALKPGPGQREGVLFVGRDVTASVVLEQRLILTQRMAAIGTLALSVSHELNNMLGGLRGLAELAAGNESAAPKLIEACRAVAERGGVIAGRMTSLSRAGAPRQERRIDVVSVARMVVGMMGPSLAPLRIGVAESYETVPPTWINEGQVLQVLLNLIANARDSIGSDGQIDIAVRHDEDQNHIVISVHDSGVGIRAEDLPRVFDPFFTTKLGPGGEEPLHLGLGLPESRSILRECGGTIDVESELGQGATFTVRLPVRSVPTAPRRRSTAAGVMPDRGTAMLVVDDDKLMRFWLTQHLGDLGYDVVEAATGQAAADACRDRAFPYIFLDLLMPGEIDGAATLRILKEIRPDAKIIITTAFATADIPTECLEAAHAVLRKPFGMDDLPPAFAGESPE